MLSAIGLNMSTLGVTAGLSFILSSKYKVHKSFSASIILPHVLDFNITSVPEKIVKIGIALGEDITNLSVVEASLKTIEKVRKLIIELQLPKRLSEFEIHKDNLTGIADDARKFEFFNYIPRSCDSEELYNLLESAY